jgi:hypothetical protein
MGDDDDHQWQVVKGRNRKPRGDHIPDIATAKFHKKENFDNLTTYFFTDFPSTFGAKAMFNTFNYYGHIIEVVIPAKRDKGGKRFGFARFDQVLDARRFEQALDKILVGRDKISVNLSRYQRIVSTKDREFRGSGRSKEEDYSRHEERHGFVRKTHPLHHEDVTVKHPRKGEESSYANMVKKGKDVTTAKNLHGDILSFEAKREDMERLRKAFVG